MSLKNVIKKMLRKSSASSAWVALFKKAGKSYKI